MSTRCARASSASRRTSRSRRAARSWRRRLAMSSSKNVRILAALATVLAAPVARAACTPPLDACLDDFACYQTYVTRNTPAFTPVTGVTLVDQFESVTATVAKPVDLCAPADKNGEGV